MKLFIKKLMREDLKIQSVKSIFLLGAILLLIIGCNGQKKAAVDTTIKETSANSPLKLVTQANYAPSDSVETHLITSAKELSKFFSKVNRTRKPGIPVPEVDFSKDMVVIYCAGTKGNGSQPELIITEETDTELILGMDNVIKPEKPKATVNPFTIYTMPTTSKKVRFMAVE